MSNYIVFGSGGVGIKCKNKLEREGHRVVGFVDNDSTKWMSQVEGITVYSPYEIPAINADAVAIGIYKAASTVKKQLIEMGIKEEKICVPIEPDRIFLNERILFDKRKPIEENRSASTAEFERKRRETDDADFIEKLERLKNTLKEYNVSLWNVCVCGGGILQAYGLRKSKRFDDVDIIMTSDYRDLYGRGLIIVSETAEMHKQNEYDISDDEIILNPENHFIFQGVKFMNIEIYYKYLKKNEMFDEIELANTVVMDRDND